MKWLVRETPIYLLCVTYGFPMFFSLIFGTAVSETAVPNAKVMKSG